MNIKKHIPNTITCGNLLCGCLAIVQAFEGNLVWAAYLVGIAAVLDFFDGFAARLLKVSSPIGKDLDSLADMVTFGVVPGIVMYQLIQISQFLQLNNTIYPPLSALTKTAANDLSLFEESLKYIAFIIPIFSAIRLAKFNNDTRQSDSFIGVPTPANAVLICSIPLIIKDVLGYANPFVSNLMNSDFKPIITDIYVGFAQMENMTSNSYQTINEIFLNPYILCLLSLIMSLLLIAELPLFALKFKHFKWKDNEIRFVFLGLSVVLLVTLQFVGIPLVIILYILMSVVNNFFFKKKVS